MTRAKRLWNITYNMIIRSVFRCVRGTNLIFIYHMLNTTNIENRMKQLNSQFFSRIIRTPHSGIMHKIMKKQWWKIIKFWTKRYIHEMVDENVTSDIYKELGNKKCALHNDYKKKRGLCYGK